jgi:hypothetical protein
MEIRKERGEGREQGLYHRIAAEAIAEPAKSPKS